MLPAGDAQLIQIVDDALADATRRGGHWLVCKPGCNQCCTGVFRISALDAERLREGLRRLDLADPQRSTALRLRIASAAHTLTPGFPGNAESGILHNDDASHEAFEDFANDQVCPVLDPLTGTCDLYAARPLTCRTFGPPVRTVEDGLGVCELCFDTATTAEIAAAEMYLPPDELEAAMLHDMHASGETIVAFALRNSA